jgi:MFS family permease
MSRRLAVQAAVVYLALRAVSALFIMVAARQQVPVRGWTDSHPDYLDMTVLWDGSWYRAIAEHGYPQHVPVVNGVSQQNELAFYPLFPLLARMGMEVTGLGFPAVAATLALLLGLGAAVLMTGLLNERVPHHGGVVALGAMAVWAAFPSAVSLQLAYTESLAMLLLCAFLWAVMRQMWGVAGAFGLTMGVARPIAVPLGVVMVVALWLRWRQRRQHPVARGEVASALFGLAGCAAGAVLWPLAVWGITGSRMAYGETMAAWRPSGTLVPFRPWWDMAHWVFRDTAYPGAYGPIALVAVVGSLLVSVLGPWAAGLGWELRAWCLAYPAYLGAVLDPFTSIFRYLLPLFPLVVVLIGAGWSSERRVSRWWWGRVVLLVALGVVSQVWWVRWLLVYIPPSDYPP